jgi:branched-chain amino acid transport system substrate-binding protein
MKGDFVSRMGVRVAAVGAALVLLGACSSSSKTGQSSSTTIGTSGSAVASGRTVTIGVITDLTGPGSNTSQFTPDGIKAGVALAANEGYHIKYILADAATSPTQALSAAQKLVEQDHVFAIISVSSTLFGAEPYLLKAGVPVFGSGFDGPEWTDTKNTNMFTTAPTDYTKIYSTGGEFMKSQGVTKCATIGLSDSPSASQAAKNQNASCEKAGLPDPYLFLTKFGATDVGPMALGVKDSGADGVLFDISPVTGFGIAAVLQQLGAHMKAMVFGAGYGGDLLSNPAGVKAAQGYDFQTFLAPMELNTPATQLFAANLAAVGVNEDPTYGQQQGYQAVAAFMAGAKAAGGSTSQSDFIKATRGVTGFTVDGLLASPLSFADYSPPQLCYYVVKLTGDKFVPLSQKPYCGGVVGTAAS